jgi:hypothetical protein
MIELGAGPPLRPEDDGYQARAIPQMHRRNHTAGRRDARLGSWYRVSLQFL